MSKSNSRLSISSGQSIPLSEPMSFEQYLQIAQDIPTSPDKPEIAAKDTKKAKQVSSKYGIHVQRQKAAADKAINNFVELNKQKLEKKLNSTEKLNTTGQSSWRNLIKGVLDFQRGKIPLLLAVEAGNQSMCRELLSTQTTEQLQVNQINITHSIILFLFLFYEYFVLLFSNLFCSID